jgi:hypothetical protein
LDVLCATGLTSLLLCGAAAARSRPVATFSATAEGTETVSATMAGKEENCPPGTGSETVQFAGRPVRIRIEDTGPFLAMEGLSAHGEDDRQPFVAAGTVTRSADGSFTCRLDTPPDCGTKPFAGLLMWLQGASVRRGRLTLAAGLRAEDPPDVFSTCPTLGGFPALFATGTPQAHITGGALFDRRRRTLVLTAMHDTTTESLGGTTHVEKSLKLTLRRI